jgi:hypothetical protein
MLITDQFVYIHQSKTGGTFVTKTVQRIHESRGENAQTISAPESGTSWKYRLKKRVRRQRFPNAHILLLQHHGNQHGKLHEVPKQFLDRPIIGTIRNPYDRYVSQYEFLYWKNNPNAVKKGKEMYAHFPELSFEEFLHFREHLQLINNREWVVDDSIGFQTIEFLHYYGLGFPEILADAEALRKIKGVEDISPVHFIATHQLNQNLYDFLLSVGYPQNEIAFILGAEKIFPKEGGRKPEQKWEKYYTQELKQYVRQKEWLLFELFPQFDV